jgi:hypothetical protein
MAFSCEYPTLLSCGVSLGVPSHAPKDISSKRYGHRSKRMIGGSADIAEGAKNRNGLSSGTAHAPTVAGSKHHRHKGFDVCHARPQRFRPRSHHRHLNNRDVEMGCVDLEPGTRRTPTLSRRSHVPRRMGEHRPQDQCLESGRSHKLAAEDVLQYMLNFRLGSVAFESHRAGQQQRKYKKPIKRSRMRSEGRITCR